MRKLYESLLDVSDEKLDEYDKVIVGSHEIKIILKRFERAHDKNIFRREWEKIFKKYGVNETKNKVNSIKDGEYYIAIPSEEASEFDFVVSRENDPALSLTVSPADYDFWDMHIEDWWHRKYRIYKFTKDNLFVFKTIWNWLKEFILHKNPYSKFRFDAIDINESILNVEDNEAGMDDMIIRTHIWNSLIRKGRSRMDTLNKLREEIFDKKCKKITLPLSSQRNKTVSVDSNKYYIYFVVNYAQDVIMVAMAYGDEKLYLIDYPANQDGIANRFASLTPSKLKKDLSHNGRGELYEAPDSLIWLYEKMKKESGY